MLFNSTTYLVFLAMVVIAFFHLRPQGRRVMLLIASIIFYCVWSVPFVFLMLGCISVNWAAARWMAATASKRQRNAALGAAVVVSLGILALFKYANFFRDSAYGLVGAYPWPHLDLILPLGISFYTFQAMSYCIDVYRGQIDGKRSWFEVALFVSFFPQLVAGPIVRGSELIPQLDATQHFDWVNIRIGLAQVAWGLFKKVFVADAMAAFVSDAYGDPLRHSGLSLLLATYAFAVQIYCDFSGYSDIAIGSARMLGINLPRNFNSPYLACSLRDFWRRWHITLSTWLRDYLYVPLGGNRRGTVRTYVNLMVTMVLGGLWHGAGWNWVVWGGLQGAVMSLERLVGLREAAPRSTVVRLIRWVVTFHIVCFSWVLFRASSLEQAWLITERIATAAEGRLAVGWTPLGWLTVLLAAEMLSLQTRWLELWSRRPVLCRWATYATCLVLILTFQRAVHPEFIYFQF